MKPSYRYIFVHACTFVLPKLTCEYEHMRLWSTATAIYMCNMSYIVLASTIFRKHALPSALGGGERWSQEDSFILRVVLAIAYLCLGRDVAIPIPTILFLGDAGSLRTRHISFVQKQRNKKPLFYFCIAFCYTHLKVKEIPWHWM